MLSYAHFPIRSESKLNKTILNADFAVPGLADDDGSDTNRDTQPLLGAENFN